MIPIGTYFIVLVTDYHTIPVRTYFVVLVSVLHLYRMAHLQFLICLLTNNDMYVSAYSDKAYDIGTH